MEYIIYYSPKRGKIADYVEKPKNKTRDMGMVRKKHYFFSGLEPSPLSCFCLLR